MLNGRLYRVTLMPLLAALAVAALSLGSRPAPLAANLAPDAFEGAHAFSELSSLAAGYPGRDPGGPGDGALAVRIAHALEGLGGTAGGAFAVRTQSVDGQTVHGARTLTTVIAQRPGSTGASPILLIAHRDAAAPTSRAQLSGTAVLLELARVFAARQTKRPIILASTSGGSGGAAGAAALAPALHAAPDAAIVLGDLAATRTRPPVVVPYSDGFGSASLLLQRTLDGAITREAGIRPGAPSTLGDLMHLAVPIAAGEQGVLDAQGVPAVLVAASGERGPGAAQAVSRERIEGLGRAVLSAVDALDAAPDLPAGAETGIAIRSKTMPAWAVTLLAVALLLGPLVVAVDGLARMRRRRVAVGRWTLWVLAGALPFLAVALLARAMGLLGAIPAPPAPVLPGSASVGAGALAALAALALALALGWVARRALTRRLGCVLGRQPHGAGLAVVLVLAALALVVLSGNPYTALLLAPALHLWLLLASPELRPRRAGSLALVALGLLPLVAVAAFYARQLGTGSGAIVWSAALLFSGGHIGIGSALLWSVALGCAASAALLALSPPAEPPIAREEGPPQITIRGPLSYAGPGSLGGTESALRR